MRGCERVCSAGSAEREQRDAERCSCVSAAPGWVRGRGVCLHETCVSVP